MVRIITYSSIDPAGRGIAEALISNLSVRDVKFPRAIKSWYIEEINSYLVEFSEDVIYFDFLDEVFKDILDKVEFYLILSRHSSAAQIKSLTTHHTGNPTEQALVGGRPYELSIANPPLAKALLKVMVKVRDEYGLEDFRVTYEVTHHGPTNLKKPLTFVEIGSTEKEWTIREAHEAIATAVIEVLSKDIPTCEATTGIGGPHYATIFTKRALESDECYGHIISRYALKELRDKEDMLRKIIRDAILKSVPRSSKVNVLKKVSRGVRDTIESLAKELGLKVEYV